MTSITRCRAGVSVSTPFELVQVRQKNRADEARGREGVGVKREREVMNEAREREVMDVKRELQAELESAREVIRGLEMGLESGSVEGKGKGQRKPEKREKEYEVRVWSFWDRWGICLGFVLLNTLLILPLAYLITTFFIPSPWQWLAFILSYHVMLAGAYEIAMSLRDRWEIMLEVEILSEWRERIIRDREEKVELEKWDMVVLGLERALGECRRYRGSLEEVERVGMGVSSGMGGEGREEGEKFGGGK